MCPTTFDSRGPEQRLLVSIPGHATVPAVREEALMLPRGKVNGGATTASSVVRHPVTAVPQVFQSWQGPRLAESE